MAADFSGVDVAYDAATATGKLTGKARGPKQLPAHLVQTVQAEDGSTTKFEGDITVTRVVDLGVKVIEVVDDQGGIFTIAADGLSYTRKQG